MAASEEPGDEPDDAVTAGLDEGPGTAGVLSSGASAVSLVGTDDVGTDDVGTPAVFAPWSGASADTGVGTASDVESDVPPQAARRLTSTMGYDSRFTSPNLLRRRDLNLQVAGRFENVHVRRFPPDGASGRRPPRTVSLGRA